MAFLKLARSVARTLNAAIIKQSQDRECRFAHEGVRHLSASEDTLGVVRPGDTMAVAYVVGTHHVLLLHNSYGPTINTMSIVISQIRKGNGEEYLDVHLGEIVQLTFSYRKTSGKPKNALLDRALIDDPNLEYTMRWYDAVRMHSESNQPKRSEGGEKLYTIPLACKEGYNWSVHNSDSTSGGTVLTMVAITQIKDTPYWALDKDCEKEANEIALDSMMSCGDKFEFVGDGREGNGMTTTTSDLGDTNEPADGKQDQHTKETMQRLQAARQARGQKAAATRLRNLEMKKQMEAQLTELERKQKEKNKTGRDSRVHERQGLQGQPRKGSKRQKREG